MAHLKNKIEIQSLCHSYNDISILDNVSMQIDEGEIICILGPSGCGKSTLLRMISGLEEPDSGDIIIDGINVIGSKKFIPAEKRFVGMVFQNPSLFPHLSVIENVMFGLLNGHGKHNNKDECRPIADERIEAVGMSGFDNSFPHMLSGGQQQRVALARTLVTNPHVMLLDEPFANLDSNLRKKIREDSSQLLKTMNIATILVTHDPEEALLMADRIYVMQKGRIIQEGTPKDLYNNPNNEFIARFFGDLNKIKITVNGNGKQANTPFGIIDIPSVACENIEKVLCSDIKADMGVQLCIRPEAISVSEQNTNTASAVIDEIRFLGFSAIIYCIINNEGQWKGEKLKVRISGDNLPQKGDVIHLILDQKRIFIFLENMNLDGE